MRRPGVWQRAGVPLLFILGGCGIISLMVQVSVVKMYVLAYFTGIAGLCIRVVYCGMFQLQCSFVYLRCMLSMKILVTESYL